MNTSLLATAPFVKRRKTSQWSSPAHPCVSVEYLWQGESDPVSVLDIRIVGNLMEETTVKFFERFGMDFASGDATDIITQELAEFLHGIHPRGVDADAKRD
jgi:hypothetical protein